VTAALQGAWPGVEIKDVEPLLGGQWATMAHVRIAGGPDGTPDDVVVRVVPDPVMGAKEIAVQAAAADAGIRTPRVHLTGEAGGPLGGAWAVMDFAPGRSMLAGLSGAAAIRQLPALVRRLPAQLANSMAAVHRLDADPVARRTRAAAPTASLNIDDLWEHLQAAADDMPPLRAALERLQEARPSHADSVVCHGDIHPFNLLLDPDGEVTVLDWTAAAIAPPAYDVAATWLLLRYPPLQAPAALRPVINAGAALLARGFIRSYRRANPTADLAALDWYKALHGTRVLIDLTRWTRAADPRAKTHAFHLIAPGATRAVQRATGVDLSSLR
jgi:aminoglycoside phosphotransferase (APT) family kinase protein